MLVSPSLMALKRLSTSWPRALMLAPLELLVDDASEVELVVAVLGTA